MKALRGQDVERNELLCHPKVKAKAQDELTSIKEGKEHEPDLPIEKPTTIDSCYQLKL